MFTAIQESDCRRIPRTHLKRVSTEMTKAVPVLDTSILGASTVAAERKKYCNPHLICLFNYIQKNPLTRKMGHKDVVVRIYENLKVLRMRLNGIWVQNVSLSLPWFLGVVKLVSI